MKNKNIEIRCYKQFYYLHRVEGNKHYLGRFDTRFGWVIRKLTDDTFKEKTRVVKEKDYTHGGLIFHPFTQDEIKKFFKLTIEKLEDQKEKSKNYKYL